MIFQLFDTLITPDTLAVQEVLHKRSDIHDLDILVIQTPDLRQHFGEAERCWQWDRYHWSGFASGYRREGTAEAIWR
jgi:hypothetical protein